MHRHVLCVCFYNRRGNSATIDPSGSFAAISDSLGRVSLFDCRRSCVIHIFKGFRDASCIFRTVCRMVVVVVVMCRQC